MARSASVEPTPAEAPVEQPQPPILVRLLYGYFPQNPENYPDRDVNRCKFNAGDEIELPYYEAKALLRGKRAERVEDDV